MRTNLVARIISKNVEEGYVALFLEIRDNDTQEILSSSHGITLGSEELITLKHSLTDSTVPQKRQALKDHIESRIRNEVFPQFREYGEQDELLSAVATVIPDNYEVTE